MADKTPAEIIPGTASETSVVHSSEDGITTRSRGHTEGDISRLQSAFNAFDVNRQYKINDLVVFDSTIYINVTPNTPPAAFVPAEWQIPQSVKGELVISSEAELTSKLGGSLTIPDGLEVTIVFESGISLGSTMVFTSPILIGEGSEVTLLSRTGAAKVLYAGTGAFIRNDGAKEAGNFRVFNLTLIGGLAVTPTPVDNSFIDLAFQIPLPSNLVEIQHVLITLWEFVGVIKQVGSVSIHQTNFNTVEFGIVFKNIAFADLNTIFTNSVPGANPTTITMIGSHGVFGTGSANVRNFAYDAVDGGDALVAFDSNTDASSRFNVTDNSLTENIDLFQRGTNLVIDSVADNGSGLAEFTTAVNHNLSVGDRVTLSGFTTNTLYNHSALVTVVGAATTFETGVAFGTTEIGTLQDRSIDVTSVVDNGGIAQFTTPADHGFKLHQMVVLSGFSESTYNVTEIITNIVTATQFETAIVFVAGDTGLVNGSSLDSRDLKVSASRNASRKDSMSQAEVRTSGTLEITGAQNVFVPVVDITPVITDFVEDFATERFSVITSTGIITYIGLAPATFSIGYQLDADKTSGGDQSFEFSLFINGVEQPKTTIIAIGSNPLTVIYSLGLFELLLGDTLQIFRKNTTNTSNTNISNLKLIVMKA